MENSINKIQPKEDVLEMWRKDLFFADKLKCKNSQHEVSEIWLNKRNLIFGNLSMGINSLIHF